MFASGLVGHVRAGSSERIISVFYLLHFYVHSTHVCVWNIFELHYFHTCTIKKLNSCNFSTLLYVCMLHTLRELGDSLVAKTLACALAQLGFNSHWILRVLIFSFLNELVVLPHLGHEFISFFMNISFF
jgi:hypothetical protein